MAARAVSVHAYRDFVCRARVALVVVACILAGRVLSQSCWPFSLLLAVLTLVDHSRVVLRTLTRASGARAHC